MESLVDGVYSLSKTRNSASAISNNPSFISETSRPSRPPSLRQSRYDAASTTSYMYHPNCSIISHKHSYKLAYDNMQHEEIPNLAKQFCDSKKGSDFLGQNDVDDKMTKTSENQVSIVEPKSGIKHPVDDSENCNPTGLLESGNLALGLCKEGSRQFNGHLISQSAASYCPSPQNSLYSATLYAEAKQSFTNTEISECVSSYEKSGESGEASNSCDIESRKTSTYRGSTGSDVSDETSSSSLSSARYKPHKANDIRWEAIQAVRSRYGMLCFDHFSELVTLGHGDIGRVYLSELIGTGCYFAVKAMDKAYLATRKKLLRSQIEREILQSLDHPFLPTLYAHFDTENFSYLVMEFCPGGDMYALRQRQPGKCFPEHAARFYVAEVLLALEYLHMLGIIYRDLKPENVLVREDGHIMLSDFDLSLRCAVSPTLVKPSNSNSKSKNMAYCVQPSCIEPTCVMQPDCVQPTCFTPRFLSNKGKKTRSKNEISHQASPLLELIAEPTSARSMSFVGTHEYLAPEIIKGEGHGSAVDWWTFGIFLYELLFGETPFKAPGKRDTLYNVVGQPLRFPESPTVSFAARDLIRGLLVKEPQHRLAYRRGATEVKQHPFFQNINWALIRCTRPPEVPRPEMLNFLATDDALPQAPASEKVPGMDVKPPGNYLEIDFF